MILFQNRFIAREEATVDIEDRGYQFGDGVYEVIRVYGGQFFCMKGHMERLVRSTAEIRVDLPMPIVELEDKLTKLLRENNLKDGYVYMQITRGAAPRSHDFPKAPNSVLTAYTKEMARPLDQMAKGIRAYEVEDIRWLRCDIKSLNLLANVLAKQKAREHDCVEAIFHRGETVTEGSSSNILMINGHELRTHPANHLVLNGITKTKVFRLAETLGLSVKEETFTVEELLNADEVLITSTTAEITPVVQVGDKKIADGVPGRVTRKLQAAFEQAIANECKTNMKKS